MSSVEKEQKSITRREFVKEAAVGAAGVAAAGALTSYAAPTPEVIKETVEVVKEVPVSTAETVYEVYPPYGVPTVKVLQPVPRLDTLEGKTICGMGTSFHGAETFPVIAELLKKKYPTAKFVGQDILKENDYKKEDFLAAIPDLLKQHGCDAVIVGNGC